MSQNPVPGWSHHYNSTDRRDPRAPALQRFTSVPPGRQPPHQTHHSVGVPQNSNFVPAHSVNYSPRVPVYFHHPEHQQPVYYPVLQPSRNPIPVPIQYANTPRRMASDSSSSSRTVTPRPTPTPTMAGQQLPNLPPSQFADHPFLLQQLTTPVLLQHAVQLSPSSVLAQMTYLLSENERLQSELKSVIEDLESTRKDYQAKRVTYDKLVAIQDEKNVLLWKHIFRTEGGYFELNEDQYANLMREHGFEPGMPLGPPPIFGPSSAYAPPPAGFNPSMIGPGMNPHGHPSQMGAQAGNVKGGRKDNENNGSKKGFQNPTQKGGNKGPQKGASRDFQKDASKDAKKGSAQDQSFGLVGAQDRFMERELAKKRQDAQEKKNFEEKIEKIEKTDAENEKIDADTEKTPVLKRTISPIRRGSPLRKPGSPLTDVSELSEKSDGVASLVESSKSIESVLNPAATSFLPNFDSPKKYHEEVSSAGLFEHSITDADLKKLIDSIPSYLRGICPISLSTNLPCNVFSCHLEKLCDTHQVEMGEGCHLKPPIQGEPGGCSFNHLLRSCPDEVQGYKCSYKSDSTDSRRKKGHNRRRVHETIEGNKKYEWNGRLAVAKLIDAHREGRY